MTKLIAGIDEVGRGPLAGPVVSAAVILGENHGIQGLTDSKKLSAKKREILAQEIRCKSVAWALGRAEVHEIDQFNILQATFISMRRALHGLHIKPEHVLIDGNRVPPELGISAEAIIKGDLKVAEISAASILAKVSRDREMQQAGIDYPAYGFERHMGYPTAMHLSALQAHGICPIHRKSFAPVKKQLDLWSD